MPTTWTNPVAPGAPILAANTQQLINAITQNRSDAGLPAFNWTYPTASPSTPIRARQLLEMREAIQELWDQALLGNLPNWASGVTPGGPSAGSGATPI